MIEIPIEFWDFSKIFKKKSNIFKNIFFEKIFSSRKKISKFFWTPMSIRNFPKIPKIILIKSADQAKGEKNPFSKLATTFCAGSDVLLRGATLKLKMSQLQQNRR